MQIKFKSDTFLWLKENAGSKSIPAFVVEIVERTITGPQAGVKRDGKTEGREQLHKSV